MALLNIKASGTNSGIEIQPEPDTTAVVSEMWIPGALHIPWMLSSIVPLGRMIEDITAEYHSQLRRDLHKNRSRYCLQQVTDEREIELADRDMLRPYAKARHGTAAAQIAPHEVRRMAQQYGRLDLLLLEGQVVGCQLGCAFTRSGKRYWSTNRCGYPETVFSDHKQLRDYNSMNIYLAMEWAIDNGFDYYDIGPSLGRPGDGLLEWKRRRGGVLDTMGNSGYFHVRLPRVGAAQFLWDAPLFAVENRKLTLHLGIPSGKSDTEIAHRYREMGFGGLNKLYLHCAKMPDDHLLETLRGYYAGQRLPPGMELVIGTG